MKSTEKDKLREQFQLKAQNVIAVLSKRRNDIQPRQRDMVLNLLKKVELIKLSFDINCDAFKNICQTLQISYFQERQVLFEKGQEGTQFFVVLYGKCFVQSQPTEQGRHFERKADITYYPGDSFGEISLIYNVPRGATVVANRQTTLLRISKKIFTECTRFEKKLYEMNKFFREHPYLDMAEDFIIRVFSSSSTRVKFREGDVIVSDGRKVDYLLFFMRGKVKVIQPLMYKVGGKVIEKDVEIQELSENSVFGEYFMVNNLISTVKVIATDRGEYAKVSLQQNVNSANTPLSRRILETAARFPTEQEVFEHYKNYLYEQYRRSETLMNVYKDDPSKIDQFKACRRKYKEIMSAELFKPNFPEVQ